MTELEKELKATLQIQEQMFFKELKSVTKIYEKHLADITTAYNKQMNEALEVIERQSNTVSMQDQLLARYKNELSEIKISLDQEPLDKLKNQLNNLHNRLDELESLDSRLVEQLNAVLREL